MAKDKPAPEEGAKEEKQVPEKPKRKPADTGLIQLVGIIAGTVIVMVVILYLAFKFLIYPDLKELTGANTADSTAVEDKHNKDKHDEKHEGKNDDSWMDEETTSFFEDEQNTHFFETGRITTNPKGTTKQFVVINLGLIYMTKPGEEGGGGKEGEEGEGPSLPPTTMARIKHGINMILGKYSAEQLKANQDSLPYFFKDELKPIFRQKQMLLRDVIIQEIIIQ